MCVCRIGEAAKVSWVPPESGAWTGLMNCCYRPSHARIGRLETENQRLKESLSALKAQLVKDQTNHSEVTASSSAEPQVRTTIHIDNNNTLQARCGSSPSDEPAHRPGQVPRPSQNCALKRIFAPDKDSCYHGPTSAVYDEHPANVGPRRNTPAIPRMPPEWVKTQLMAESANQRQLETVNFIQGKLDFDGVDPELGMHLLSIHWSRQQSTGPVVYRTAFMRDMACAGPYFSKLLLNAIYFSSSKFTKRPEVRRDPDNSLTAGWSYRQRVVDLLSRCFDKSSITTIQALLIMSTALFSWCDEKSVSWLYAGMAYNMIIDLGIHVDANTLKRRLTEEEIEIRRRLYWAAYGIGFVT